MKQKSDLTATEMYVALVIIIILYMLLALFCTKANAQFNTNRVQTITNGIAFSNAVPGHLTSGGIAFSNATASAISSQGAAFSNTPPQRVGFLIYTNTGSLAGFYVSGASDVPAVNEFYATNAVFGYFTNANNGYTLNKVSASGSNAWEIELSSDDEFQTPWIPSASFTLYSVSNAWLIGPFGGAPAPTVVASNLPVLIGTNYP